MKKLTTLILTALLCCCLLCACTNEVVPEALTPTESVRLLTDSVTLEKYDSCTLTVIGQKENAEVVWSSQNTEVATVSDGVVSAVGEGKTIVVATCDGVDLKCNVAVNDSGYIPILSVGVDENVNFAVGQTFRLTPSLTFNGKAYDDFDCEYSCDGAAVSVDQNGKITANSVGSCVVEITATWRSETISASFTVNVVDVSEI